MPTDIVSPTIMSLAFRFGHAGVVRRPGQELPALHASAVWLPGPGARGGHWCGQWSPGGKQTEANSVALDKKTKFKTGAWQNPASSTQHHSPDACVVCALFWEVAEPGPSWRDENSPGSRDGRQFPPGRPEAGCRAGRAWWRRARRASFTLKAPGCPAPAALRGGAPRPPGP